MKKDDLLAGIMGLVIGDAVGVPVEFKTRVELKADPVKDMRGYGKYNQPVGTWSDDSSLTFCLMESLCTGYDLADLGAKFVSWFNDGYLTPHNEAFDIGICTEESIRRLEEGVAPVEAGGRDEYDNGNGSLMRILPLAYYLKDIAVEERLKKIAEVSSLTHAHPRSILGCGIYVEFAIKLVEGAELEEAYQETKEIIKEYYQQAPYQEELEHYHRILEAEIGQLKEDEIKSTGYVVDTLEAALWVLFNSHSYQEAILKAVNLGEDTDTVAAVTGGLAGIYYGYQALPKEWMGKIVKKDEILKLVDEFQQSL
ncbi:ADP-ribosylglycohydrolase family protein [Natroniella sulfidigena]|uniref:ADP-ribosylglycohydrolase family protein n=1 Tax=Natroniella sulfidigena TaxID=723921 RepID=UPI00200A592E|nr:ADP-ribosylglycohydrolase family protein [Natroniella sulfidigena]MCK8818141.1 ADP-ribosylglycohydrolase family protein [Natroniella sulfidigena]